MQPDKLEHDQFAHFLHAEFVVIDDPAVPVPVILSEVSDCTATPHQESFSLVFLGSKDHFMPQGIHRIVNQKIGELDIFWVPIGLDQAGFHYEAVFTRLIG